MFFMPFLYGKGLARTGMERLGVERFCGVFTAETTGRERKGKEWKGLMYEHEYA